MAYDEELAERIRASIADPRSVTEKEMFGGIAFLYRGKMFAGLAKGDLMVRVGPAAYEAALAKPHVRPMDFTGKPLRGYVYVAPEGLRSDAALAKWVNDARAHATTLPAKKKRPTKSAKKKPARRLGRAQR